MSTYAQPIELTGEIETLAPSPAEHHGHAVEDGLLKARPALRPAVRVGRFLLHFVEMQIVMALGMVVFGLLARQLRASPTYGAAFQSGADLYILVDGLFMSVPMVAWMFFRGHGWRHSLEMGASMLLPGMAIIALGWLGAGAYLPWLAKSACGVMCLGMLVYMLFGYEHFAAKHARAANSDIRRARIWRRSAHE